MSGIGGQAAPAAPGQPGQPYQYETSPVQQQQQYQQQYQYQQAPVQQEQYSAPPPQYTNYEGYTNGNVADPQQTPAPVSYQYDAAESEALFRMVEQPKDQADAETMEYADEYGEEEEEGEVEQALTEDSYSLLYTADFFSRTTFFAITVVILQAGMLFLTFFDLIDANPDGEQNKTNGVSNRLKIPPGTSPFVTLAQFLGMVLTVMLMGVEGDIVVGGSQLLEGYDDGILHDMPNATFPRWLVTGSMQLMVGVVLVIDSFILSMKSTSVIDLVLNLTALYFVQEIDEIAFKLADMGILASQIQADCEKVKNLKQVSPPEFIARRTLWKRIMLILLFITLTIGYAFVVSWQMNGVYLCKHVYIQFGDAFLPEMAYYSGQFHHQGFGWSDRENDRVTYIDDTGKLKLAYCNSETAWTISWVKQGSSSCDYIFKSSNTDTFDVAEVDNWVVKTSTTGDVPVDWLKVVCNDCTPELCNEAYGDCKVDNSKGSKLNKCECKSKDRQGLNCDLPATCRYFDLDARTTDELAVQPGGYFLSETEFVDLSFVPGFDDDITLMHHRSIYAPYGGFNDAEGPAVVENISTFMLFSGRRWVIYTLPEGSSEHLAKDEFITFLRDNDPANNPVAALENISKTYPHFKPLFFSSPVNYGGANYVREYGNSWVLTQPVPNYTVLPRQADDNQPLPATYVCSDCSGDPGICQNNGFCNSGYCHCSYFFRGPNCERSYECLEFGDLDRKSTETGCYFEQGHCNPVTRLCEECVNGTFGNLCQYGGQNALSEQDQLFCAKCEASDGSVGECDVHTKICPCLPGYSGDICQYDSTTAPPTDDLVETIVNTTIEIVETILNTTTESVGGVSNELGAFANETANALGGLAQPNPPADAAEGGPPQSEAPAEGSLPLSNLPGDGSGNLPPP